MMRDLYLRVCEFLGENLLTNTVCLHIPCVQTRLWQSLQCASRATCKGFVKSTDSVRQGLKSMGIGCWMRLPVGSSLSLRFVCKPAQLVSRAAVYSHGVAPEIDWNLSQHYSLATMQCISFSGETL